MELVKFIGFLLPPFIDLINKKVENSDARFWVSVLFCALVGIIVSYIEASGWASLEATIAAIFIVFGTAQLSYKGIYEESKFQGKIRA